MLSSPACPRQTRRCRDQRRLLLTPFRASTIDPSAQHKPYTLSLGCRCWAARSWRTWRRRRTRTPRPSTRACAPTCARPLGGRSPRGARCRSPTRPPTTAPDAQTRGPLGAALHVPVTELRLRLSGTFGRGIRPKGLCAAFLALPLHRALVQPSQTCNSFIVGHAAATRLLCSYQQSIRACVSHQFCAAAPATPSHRSTAGTSKL